MSVLIPPSIFQVGLSTLGLRASYPVRDASVLQAALPPELLPPDFDPEDPAPRCPLTYLDSTASTKMTGPVKKAWDEALEGYANTHSRAHVPARMSTQAYQDAHQAALRFVGADPGAHTAIFVGSGATGAVNRLARTLFGRDNPDGRDVVLYSGMEHHANQLPWQRHAPRTDFFRIDPIRGVLDEDHLRSQIDRHKGRVRLVAVTGVSNVTGIVNDVAAIARMAHEAGAEILVDAAQMAPHLPIAMRASGIDYLVFSGHKIYAPGSPGVLVAARSAFAHEPDEWGGGIVTSVGLDRYELSDKLPEREEAGTPNIPGAIALAASLKLLEAIGMPNVWDHEATLTALLISGLSPFPEVTVYGDADLNRTPRAGVVSFNVEGLHWSVVSKALADYFNIAVRSGRFCAHPYVNSLLGSDAAGEGGMVRASLGLYTTEEDVQVFHHAIDWIVENRMRLSQEYEVGPEGAVRRDGWDAI